MGLQIRPARYQASSDRHPVFLHPAKNIFEIYFFESQSENFYTADKINLSVKISTTTLIIYWAKLIYFQSKFSYFFTLFIQRILSSFKPHVRLLSTKNLNNKCMLCIAL